MIYYPLSVLMLTGIKQVLIISTSKDIKNFEELLGDGKQLGIEIFYAIQPNPDGIAQAFIIGENFIKNDSVALILGDNIFFGQGFSAILEESKELKDGAIILAYNVNNPERFGVVEFDNDFKVISLEEKPKNPRSNFAITGLYFYDNKVVEIAKNMKPSDRGELEITNINAEYLKKGKLSVKLLGRGFAWLDAGTSESLLEASHFVSTIENRQGFKIACIEEISYRKGYINKKQLLDISLSLKNSDYGLYLKNIAEE